MPITTPPSMTPAPSPAPQRNDRTTFSARVDAFVTWVIAAVTEFAALAANVYSNAVEAFNNATSAAASAASASASADAAASAANAPKWVSGTTYAQGNCVWSPVNYLTYRRKVAGAGATDPSADSANWELLGGVTPTGAQTLSNKTLTSPELTTAPYMNGSVRGNVVAVAALDIDCSAGNYFTKTINGNSTFTFSNAPASRIYGFTLELTHTSGTVAWPATVKWPGDTAPTLTTGKTHLFIFVTDDGGTRWRGASLVNYTN